MLLAAAGIAAASAAAASPLGWITNLLTDAATRLARDLRDGSDRLAASGAPSRVVIHRMRASPEGCRHAYRAQLSAASAIVVWCMSEDGRTAVSGYSTSSHLPAVAVPQTWIVDKAAGEPLYIELARMPGKPTVARVY